MTLDDLRAFAAQPNVAAFLRVIREAESSQGDEAYRMLFGGELVDDLATHPNRVVERELRGKPLRSSAAGAYQFLASTWRDVAGPYGITDFSPASQDAAAVALIRRAGALDHVIAGRFEEAIRACASTWAGLPGDHYGQGGISMARAREVYLRYGGTIAGEPAAAAPAAPAAPAEPPAAPIVESIPIEVRPATAPDTPAASAPPQETRPMPPLLAALIPSIVAAIPQLARLFGSDSPVSERNARAAEVVARVVQEATGSVNLQQAAERIQSDPAARQAAADAVQANWFQLVEAGGGGIAGARAADAAAQAGGGPLWRSPSFVVACLLLPIVYLIVVAVAFNLGGPWPSDVRSALVSSAVSLILGALAGYYYGAQTSRNRA